MDNLRDALAQWCNDHGYAASNGAFGRPWDDPQLTDGERAIAYADADELLAIIRDHTSDYRQAGD